MTFHTHTYSLTFKVYPIYKHYYQHYQQTPSHYDAWCHCKTSPLVPDGKETCALPEKLASRRGHQSYMGTPRSRIGSRRRSTPEEGLVPRGQFW